jgi:hypothetical protein
MTEFFDPDQEPLPATSNARRTLWTTVGIVAAVAVGVVGGVFIGQATSASSPTSAVGNFLGGQGRPDGGNGDGPGDGARPGGFGGGLTTGTIVSINGNSILIKKTDGSEVTVTTTSGTTVTTTTSSSLDKLATGQQIRVAGQTSTSGNVTATTISEGTTSFPAGVPRPTATP